MTANCGNCPFWRATTGDEIVTGGYCQKDTPVNWRVTTPDDWCGQHPAFFQLVVAQPVGDGGS